MALMPMSWLAPGLPLSLNAPSDSSVVAFVSMKDWVSWTTEPSDVQPSRYPVPEPDATDVRMLFDEARVESAAEFVGAVHPHHCDFACLIIHLDLGNQTGMRVTGGG